MIHDQLLPGKCIRYGPNGPELLSARGRDLAPLRFELGIDNPWSYQYAWHRGHEIGVIGSTDNHTGHPGANNWTAHTQHTGGLAAVLAPENTRPGVWDALRQIPYGVMRSYADIAAAIDQPEAMRAVGRANGDNRIAIVIPCHRVVASDGDLTGYGGGLWRKEFLLAMEQAQAFHLT